jgi:hypothetical protein
MIRIKRGAEPPGLVTTRASELQRVGAIATQRIPTADEIGIEYQFVRSLLYKRQFYKCCFCEFKEQDTFNPVEHYRPKARADRSPGSPQQHGYWWLAWTWKNLLFARQPCNTQYKRMRFPLEPGSVVLSAGQAPPGTERPLLIDPAAENPLVHIQFRRTSINLRTYWIPFSRAGSQKGDWTIRIIGLDRRALLDHYNDHVARVVSPVVARVSAALQSNDLQRIHGSWTQATEELLYRAQPFVALSYDALDHYFPRRVRRQRRLSLLQPR